MKKREKKKDRKKSFGWCLIFEICVSSSFFLSRFLQSIWLFCSFINLFYVIGGWLFWRGNQCFLISNISLFYSTKPATKIKRFIFNNKQIILFMFLFFVSKHRSWIYRLALVLVFLFSTLVICITFYVFSFSVPVNTKEHLILLSSLLFCCSVFFLFISSKILTDFCRN